MKNVTIKDVAREAGVSVATVSYVLNGHKDKRITPATEQKVLHIINLLNYTPNKNAQNLKSRRDFNVALKTGPDLSLLSRSELMLFIDSLSSALVEKNYSLTYLPAGSPEKAENADALICLNVSRNKFYSLSNANQIPLIAVDALINDPIFYQINNDYCKMLTVSENYFGTSSVTYLSLRLDNLELKEHIKSVFSDVYYMDKISDVFEFVKTSGKNIVISDRTLIDLFIGKKDYAHVFCCETHEKDKLTKIIECIKLAVDRTENQEHHLFV